MFYNNAKKKAIQHLKNEEDCYNKLGNSASDAVVNLYEVRKSASKAIERVEKYINTLANSPKEFVRKVKEVRLEIKEFNDAVKIEKENASDNIKAGTATIGGVTVGGAVAALGPTTAMAIATTFGTASTGTAIASLSGAAATNAALAWLGGGAVAAGGGGMAAGNAMLALAGPIGWTIAGVIAVGGSSFAIYKNRKTAEEAEKQAVQISKNYYELLKRVREIDSLIEKTGKLKTGLDISMMVNTYPSDYNAFNEEQKKNLGALINTTKAMGILINERIA